MQKGIYAILDKVAQDIIGVLITVRHEAVAIRTFSDAAHAQGSRIPIAPKEYELVRLGYLHDATMELIPDYAVIITGEQWLAAQQQPAGPTSEQR